MFRTYLNPEETDKTTDITRANHFCESVRSLCEEVVDEDNEHKLDKLKNHLSGLFKMVFEREPNDTEMENMLSGW